MATIVNKQKFVASQPVMIRRPIADEVVREVCGDVLFSKGSRVFLKGDGYDFNISKQTFLKYNTSPI